MLIHIVLWKLKENAGGKTREENAVELKHRLEALKGLIPQIVELKVGFDFRKPAPSYEVCLDSMFKDAQGNLMGSGLFDGNAHQLLNQGTGVLIAWVLAGAGTLVLLKLVDLTVGLRVTDDEEVRGLDLTQHGEEGYSLE